MSSDRLPFGAFLELLVPRVTPELQGHAAGGRAAADRVRVRRADPLGTVAAAHEAAVARHRAAP